MASVTATVVKRFWPLRQSRYSSTIDVGTRAIWEISVKKGSGRSGRSVGASGSGRTQRSSPRPSRPVAEGGEFVAMNVKELLGLIAGFLVISIGAGWSGTAVAEEIRIFDPPDRPHRFGWRWWFILL